ncbi:MAG TPA: hypothetical protein VF450_23805 [Noviherbaspirillum sp.]
MKRYLLGTAVATAIAISITSCGGGGGGSSGPSASYQACQQQAQQANADCVVAHNGTNTNSCTQAYAAAVANCH